jgi:hypothetical protein
MDVCSNKIWSEKFLAVPSLSSREHVLHHPRKFKVVLHVLFALVPCQNIPTRPEFESCWPFQIVSFQWGPQRGSYCERPGKKKTIRIRIGHDEKFSSWFKDVRIFRKALKLVKRCSKCRVSCKCSPQAEPWICQSSPWSWSDGLDFSQNKI